MAAAAGRLLVVCTANVCRSPFMAGLAAQLLGNSPVTLGSAGTRARPGSVIDPVIAGRLAGLGVATGEHRSRQLTAAMVAEADLVLTAERSHRAEVLQLEPAAHRRVFTLRQAARLLALDDDRGRLSPRDLAEQLSRARGRQPGSADDDVLDPVGGPPQAYELAVLRMLGPVSYLCERLSG